MDRDAEPNVGDLVTWPTYNRYGIVDDNGYVNCKITDNYEKHAGWIGGATKHEWKIIQRNGKFVIYKTEEK